MLNVIISGAMGRMGRSIAEIIEECWRLGQYNEQDLLSINNHVITN